MPEAINVDEAPSGRGNYSQAMVAGEFVFCSGTVGLSAPVVSGFPMPEALISIDAIATRRQW